MNLAAVEIAGQIAKLLATLPSDEQLFVLMFLTEMTRKGPTETRPDPVPLKPKPKRRKKPQAVDVPERDLLTISQAAAHRGTQEAAIRKMLRKGRLRVHRDGDGLQKVSRTELDSIPLRKGFKYPDGTTG